MPVKEERFSQAVKSLEFDRHLGPYNLSQYGEWKRLSNYLTKNVIDRIGILATSSSQYSYNWESVGYCFLMFFYCFRVSVALHMIAAAF